MTILFRAATDMNFIVVPFLLAVKLANDDERWHHGPEYTYNLTVRRVTNLETNTEGTRAWRDLVIVLRCRPREPDGLQCRLENELSKNSYSVDQGTRNEYFEMIFDDKGIVSYEFEDTSPWRDLYPLIGNHLGAWSRLDEIETRKSCNVRYNVTRSKLDNQTTNKGFLLECPINEPIEQAVEICKQLYTDECSSDSVYRPELFGQYRIPGDSIQKLQWSVHRMCISNTNFTTESYNSIDVYNANGTTIGFVLDNIRLTLVSVEPAQSYYRPLNEKTITYARRSSY